MSLLTDTPAAVAAAPEQSRGERTTSFDVAAFPMPNGREEEWRFTPLAPLAELLDGEPAGAQLQLESDLPDGVTLARIGAEQARALGAQAPGDRAAVLAAANSDGVLHLDLPADTVLTGPVVLRLTGTGRTVFQQILVTAATHCSGTVVLRHHGDVKLSQQVCVVAADGARLDVISVQEWDDEAVHLSEHNVSVGRDAQVRHIVVSLGGAVVRINTNTRYAGPGGDFEGLGVYFADAGQHLEHRLFVDHEVEHCRSNVVYKGALQGESARTVWVGDVLIRARATGTDTYELNRNLLLTDGARADSVPNLEIETGEIVGAGHASATGRFDDEQLFYLQARGIPQAQARRLVLRGFFAGIVSQITVPEVRERVTAAIEAELTQSLGLDPAAAEQAAADEAEQAGQA